MTARTYNELFEPTPCLGLDFDAPGRILPWLILDRANRDTVYFKTATLDGALDFVAAQVANGDATAFTDDIEFWRMWRLQLAGSVKGNRAWMIAQDSEFLPRVGANVFPLRPLEQIDEAS